MQFRDLDLTTPAAQHLLGRVAARHGEPIAEAARALDRVFLLGSDWAPGLCFVGGRTAEGSLGPAGVFSVAGAAAELEDAIASAAGEAIERTAQVERVGDVARQAPLESAGLREDLHALAALLAPPDAAIDLVSGHDAVTGAALAVPADWCVRRVAPGPLRIAGTALSTGAAAGRDIDDAATRALLELVERDAAALWWLGGRPARMVSTDDPALEAATRLLAGYRTGASLRQTQVLDITTDLEVPVVIAVSSDGDGQMFACGLGCRLTRSAAAIAAITELCQSEIGLQFAEAKREQLGAAALSETDRNHLARAAMASLERMPTYAAPPRADPTLSVVSTRAVALARHLAERGVPAVLVDLRRGAVPVQKAVAPELQQYPSIVARPRLERAIRDFGGGDFWTGGCSLV